MSSVFTVALSFDALAADTDFELLYVKPAADKLIRLRGFRLCQSSEVGDAQEEGIRLSIIALPATVTASSGGTGVTPVDVDRRANTTAGFTARVHDPTLATTSGTAITKEEMAWNIRNSPCEFRWESEEEWPVCFNAEALVVRWQTTVADTITCQLTAWVQELP
jgi:hypothetical protein